MICGKYRPKINRSTHHYTHLKQISFIFKKIFLKPFTSIVASFEFSHDIDIELNPLYKTAQTIFDEDDFINQSKNIAKHLRSVSKHPNIKNGDLFVIQFNGIKINNQSYDGLGIIKLKIKKTY